MAAPQEERSSELSRSDECKLFGCSIAIYLLWVVNIALTSWNVYTYYLVLDRHRACWHCFYPSYMIITIAVECLTFLLLIVTIPLVVFRMARGVRIYVTLIFLSTWLELMLALVLSTEYQAIGDVMRMWEHNNDLTFFEANYNCCGVLGPGDYSVIGGSPPASCYKDNSGKKEDIHAIGCSTISVKPTAMTLSVSISLICKFLMVLALVIYLILLRRTNTPARSLTWRPQVRIERLPGMVGQSITYSTPFLGGSSS